MKPSILDNDIVLLGVWLDVQRCAVVGALRNVDGELVSDCIERVGQPWRALADALADAAAIGCRNGWIILCNDAAMVATLQGKRAPTPTDEKRHWIAKGEYLTGKWGGDADQWEVLQRLGEYGKWAVIQSDKLQKARELCQQG